MIRLRITDKGQTKQRPHAFLLSYSAATNNLILDTRRRRTKSSVRETPTTASVTNNLQSLILICYSKTKPPTECGRGNKLQQVRLFCEVLWHWLLLGLCCCCGRGWSGVLGGTSECVVAMALLFLQIQKGNFFLHANQMPNTFEFLSTHFG